MYQVFGGLPCESRRTFAGLATPSGTKPEVCGTFSPKTSLVALSSGPPIGQQDCDFIPRSRDCVRFGPSVAGLSDAISRSPFGGDPGGGGAGAGLDHHPCPECAGARRRTEIVGRAGGRDRRRRDRRRLGVLGRPSLATRNSGRLADVEISGRDGAERGVLPPLGDACRILRALRAADPRLRAGDGGRARDATGAVLRRQYSGGARLGFGACAARRARGLGIA